MKISRKINIVISAALLIFLHAQTAYVYSQGSIDTTGLKDDILDSLFGNISSQKVVDFDTIKFSTELPGDFSPSFSIGKSLFKPLFGSNGQLIIDNHYCELQNPYIRSALVYSRLSFQGNLTLAGLPFRTSAFFTTENNNAYRSNFVNVSFDSETYKNRIKSDISRQLKVSEKSLRFSSTLFDQVKKQLELTDRKYSINQSILDDLEKGAIDSLKWRIPSSPTDTLNTDGKSILSDSLAYISKRREETRKGLLARQDSIKHSRDSLFQLFDSSYRKFKEDSIKVAQLKCLIERGPDAILNDSLSERKTKLISAFSNIKSFQIGQPILNHNKLGLWGTAVKGVDFLTETGNWIVGAGAGKAMDHRIMFSDEQKVRFGRNIGAVQLGRKIGKDDHIAVQYFYAFDDKKTNNPITNQVITLNLKKSFKYVDIDLSGGNSDYKVSSLVISSVSEQARATGNENKALISTFKLKPGFGAIVGFKWNYIGSKYTTVGNPFLRKNYIEREFSWEQKWWKGKISSKAFYKELRTLENEMTPVENQTKGAGLQIQSNFSKGVNFYAMYSPYEMGNNHPDTAYRTLNKSGFASIGLNYQKIWDKVMWFTQASYSNSILTGDDVTPTRNEQYTYENYLNFYNKHELRATLLLNRTTPNLDSLNYSSVQLGYSLLVKQGLKVGGQVDASRFSPTSSILGIGMNCQTVLFKQIAFGLSYDLDRVQNWWGIEGARLVSTANLRLGYSW